MKMAIEYPTDWQIPKPINRSLYPRVEDIIGRTYGRWVVIGSIGHIKETANQVHHWLCLCTCENHPLDIVCGGNLKMGQSESCGCLQDERRYGGLIHGKCNSPVWKTWSCMKHRVKEGKKNGGTYATITYCARWEDFTNFYADMGDRVAGLSIDRIDNAKGYWCGRSDCPECGPLGREPNCRWATHKEQAINRRSTITMTFKGETKPLSEWESVTGLSANVLKQRYYRGWSDDKALTEPYKNMNNQRKRKDQP